jgi:hypothetical protein
MTTRFTAVVVQGALHPVGPVTLEEGSQVEVVVLSTPAAGPENAAAILAEIAAMPTQGGDPNTSRDHDRIIYGGEAHH